MDSVTLEDWGEEIFAEGVGVKWRKWVRGEGEGKKKIRLPAWLVRLQNPYTRWTGALIGAVGCNLIDACQSKVVFLPVNSLTFDDALTEAIYFSLSWLCRVGYVPAFLLLIYGSDLLAVLSSMGFGKSIVQDKASLMDLTATSLASASLQDVENGNYQLIFASAEEILAKPFLSSLKNRIYTTRKTVTRLALKRLHLNHVVSERPKGE